MNLVLRSLVACSALVVALPPGWCCAFESLFKTRSSGVSTIKQERSCCSKCRKSFPASAPKPMPTTPERCPCLDRDLGTPDSPLKPDLAAHSAVEIVLPILDLALTEGASTDACPISMTPASLHILNCLWLC